MKAEIKKVLILRFGALGDIVHTTIIAKAIKNKYPDCKITYCTSNIYEEIIKYCKYIDSVIPYDSSERKNIAYNFKFALQLRKQKFDIIFNLTNAIRDKIIAFIANPKTIVMRKKNKKLHVVESFYRAAAKKIHGLELPENLELDVDEKLCEGIKEELSKYKKPYIVFAPAGNNDKSRQGRIWKDEYWAELGNKLSNKYSGTIIITGNVNELKYHENIASKINNSVLLTGKLSLKESLCVYKLADLVVAGDTGSLHAASALGTNTIGIFGSTDIKNVKPYGDRGYYVCPKEDVCRFCWKKKCKFLKKGEIYTPCMLSIKPEDVYSLINDKKILDNLA